MPESHSYRLWKHWKRAHHGGCPESSAALRDIWASIPGVHYPQEEPPPPRVETPDAPPADWLSTEEAARILGVGRQRAIDILQGRGVMYKHAHYYAPEEVETMRGWRDDPPPGWCRRLEAIKLLGKKYEMLRRHVLKGEIRILRSGVGRYTYYNIEDITRYARRR